VMEVLPSSERISLVHCIKYETLFSRKRYLLQDLLTRSLWHKVRLPCGNTTPETLSQRACQMFRRHGQHSETPNPAHIV